MNATQQFGEDRQIRVFISSTFRDMKAEREVLVKDVFPQLRKLCEEPSFFYFLDSDYLKRFPATAERPDFQSESSESVEKLFLLTDKICAEYYAGKLSYISLYYSCTT